MASSSLSSPPPRGAPERGAQQIEVRHDLGDEINQGAERAEEQDDEEPEAVGPAPEEVHEREQLENESPRIEEIAQAHGKRGLYTISEPVSKPTILAVDDDLEVLKAIERDLRDRYRRDYRVLRAASGTEGLEIARELKQRGAPVALFLVDQRMPDMTGTELLMEVRSCIPRPARCCSPPTRTRRRRFPRSTTSA